MRAASQATRLRFRNASLYGGLGARRITTWSTFAASIFSFHWSLRKSTLRRVPMRSMEPCAEPVSRISTKSPQVASWRLPLRVHTTWRRSASSTRNSRPKSATTRPSTTTCCSRSRRVVIACAAAASQVEERVELRRADEVVLREPLDRVRVVRDTALVVAHAQLGMVVLAMRDPRTGVHEGHRLEIIREAVGLHDLARLERP